MNIYKSRNFIWVLDPCGRRRWSISTKVEILYGY